MSSKFLVVLSLISLAIGSSPIPASDFNLQGFIGTWDLSFYYNSSGDGSFINLACPTIIVEASTDGDVKITKNYFDGSVGYFINVTSPCTMGSDGATFLSKSDSDDLVVVYYSSSSQQ